MAAESAESEDSWFDIPGALKYLKTNKTTLYDCMKDGRLPFYYIKGTHQRRIKKVDLDALLTPGKPGDEELSDSM